MPYTKQFSHSLPNNSKGMYSMDRRQRKSREAIFKAFTTLLSQQPLSQITVGQIIDQADVGRATFYSHFETKDFLLKAFCEELFCHIFDDICPENCNHRHIFEGSNSDSVFLHLFSHIAKNDNNLLTLLSCRNNDVFLQYFRDSLTLLIENQITLFSDRKDPMLPDSLWQQHIVTTFIDTLKWWVAGGLLQSPEVITDYFFKIV